MSFEFNGLYYGEHAKQLYAEWKALDYDVIGYFGKALIELSPKLRHDLVILKLMDMWHHQNLKAPDPSRVQETYNPFSE